MIYNKSFGRNLEKDATSRKTETNINRVSGCWKKHPDAWKPYPDALKRHPDAFIFQLQNDKQRRWKLIKSDLNTPFEQNWENQVLMKQETML